MSQRFVVNVGSVNDKARTRTVEVGRAHRDGTVDRLGKVVIRLDVVQFVTYPESLGGDIPTGTYRSLRRANIALERFAANLPVVTPEKMAELAASAAALDVEGLWADADYEAEEGDEAVLLIDAALAASAAAVPPVQKQADAVVEKAGYKPVDFPAGGWPQDEEQLDS